VLHNQGKRPLTIRSRGTDDWPGMPAALRAAPDSAIGVSLAARAVLRTGAPTRRAVPVCRRSPAGIMPLGAGFVAGLGTALGGSSRHDSKKSRKRSYGQVPHTQIIG
jgi:hypothetical protein